MKHKIIIICLALLSIVVLSGCNMNSAGWDRESCRIAGYEEPIDPDHDNIVKCMDKCGSLEVGIHYKKLEVLREFPDTKIQPDYIKKIGSEWVECDKCHPCKEHPKVEHKKIVCKEYEYTYCDFRKNLKKKNSKTFTTNTKLEEFEGGDYWLNLESEINCEVD